MIIHCDDCCTQNLAVEKNENGKYVFVVYKLYGMGVCGPEKELYIDEEFDDVKVHNSMGYKSTIEVCKNGKWLVYEFLSRMAAYKQGDEKICGRLLRLQSEE